MYYRFGPGGFAELEAREEALSQKFEKKDCVGEKLFEKDGKIFKPKDNKELFCAVRQCFDDTEDNMKKAQEYYGPINEWDVSDITNMRGLFKGLTKFNEPLNDWDVSKVYNMSYMFAGARKFNQPLNDWDVSKVENMSHMFYNADNFIQPLNDWDVSKVENMKNMFRRNFRLPNCLTSPDKCVR